MVIWAVLVPQHNYIPRTGDGYECVRKCQPLAMSTPADPTPLTHVADLRVCRVIPRNSLNSSEGCWEKPLTEKPSHWVVWLPSRGSSWWGKLGRNTRIMSWRSLYHRTTVRKSLQAPTLLDLLWKTVTVQVISYSSATRNIMHRFTAGFKGFIYISDFFLQIHWLWNIRF